MHAEAGAVPAALAVMLVPTFAYWSALSLMGASSSGLGELVMRLAPCLAMAAYYVFRFSALSHRPGTKRQ